MMARALLANDGTNCIVQYEEKEEREQNIFFRSHAVASRRSNMQEV